MEILIILFLIVLNGLFSMAEIALVSSRKTKLEIASKNGDRRAAAALALANSPGKFLSTVQIGITLISILTGIYSGDTFKGYLIPFFQQFESLAAYAETLAVFFITLVLTYFTLILGELVPKRIGMAKAEEIAMYAVKPMSIVSLLTSPFIWLLSKTSDLIFKLIGLKENDSSVTEEEIKTLMQEGATGGTIEEIEHEIVQNVFHLGDRRITSLMTNINEVTFLDLDDDFEVNKEKIIDKKHSVYPVCQDGINDMRGLLYIKDLLGKDLNHELQKLETNLRTAIYIPENNHAYQVLEKFQEERKHFGIIVDEYGNVVGIVTMNDILDALVGDISETNEFEFEITEREDGSFLIDASLPFDDFLNEFEIDLPTRKEYTGFDTMGGFALHILQEIPATGDTFEWGEFEFEIVDMDKNRIDKMLVTKKIEDKED
ncbi:hemolysin family protein [Lacihabitans soyangensis]|uniref:HlyC/CorC family transporter n=1 Tax=Lacihabitans soyangensis TaxID=869394 RepID=A0AAE3H245_9BACT|nr:hemolysin family protein [Lacihabitans soyangensis]MCP9762611.1 HlyC/CorC family transporter [Lacihabitans soyangensis]